MFFVVGSEFLFDPCLVCLTCVILTIYTLVFFVASVDVSCMYQFQSRLFVFYHLFVMLTCPGPWQHQFVYVYPTKPDSGGKFWLSSMQFILAAMLIAQFTIVGLLSLNTAPIQVGLFVPLLCMTILFVLYLQQMHFKVATFLPTHDCVDEDERRGFDYDFTVFSGAYQQPSLTAAREVQPDPSLLSEAPLET